eukprot:TRINITY_DN12372_c0_g1_i1.p1 TRINITY_DN12372_c0_g1~~TRINITY_DN12372_c0_g1_i1.p1  ORF type:complete len:195 (+),score=40.27 TRINITY_DN12372_c0_g1_i1:474-1058(+)
MLSLKLQNCVDRNAKVKLELEIAKKSMQRQLSFLSKIRQSNNRAGENTNTASSVLKSKPNSKQPSVADNSESPSNTPRPALHEQRNGRVKKIALANVKDSEVMRNSTMRVSFSNRQSKAEGMEGVGIHTERLISCLKEQIKEKQENELRREMNCLIEDVVLLCISRIKNSRWGIRGPRCSLQTNLMKSISLNLS